MAFPFSHSPNWVPKSRHSLATPNLFPGVSMPELIPGLRPVVLVVALREYSSPSSCCVQQKVYGWGKLVPEGISQQRQPYWKKADSLSLSVKPWTCVSWFCTKRKYISCSHIERILHFRSHDFCGIKSSQSILKSRAQDHRVVKACREDWHGT